MLQDEEEVTATTDVVVSVQSEEEEADTACDQQESSTAENTGCQRYTQQCNIFCLKKNDFKYVHTFPLTQYGHTMSRPIDFLNYYRGSTRYAY